MPFRTYKEKTAGFKKLDKEIEVYFGIPTDNLNDYYEYLDNYNYENKLSSLSNTEIFFVDPESLVDETIKYLEQFNFSERCLYMGSCEMFFYFYNYIDDTDMTDEELDNLDKYLAVDHETGEIEYKTPMLERWMDDHVGFLP